jgi:hypothetical protein
MAARDRYTGIAAERRRRELALVAGVGVAAGLVAVVALGWRIGLGAGLWAAGGVLVYQWRAERASSWVGVEHRMSRLLAPLAHHGHVVLADRALPGSLAHLDHLVVGPQGVTLVDSKNWRHRRVVSGRRGRIRIGKISGRTAVRTAILETELVHKALVAELGHDVPVDAVLAVHGAGMANWRSPAVGGIPLVRAERVRNWIMDRPARLGASEVSRLAELAARLFPPYSTEAAMAHHHRRGSRPEPRTGLARARTDEPARTDQQARTDEQALTGEAEAPLPGMPPES